MGENFCEFSRFCGDSQKFYPQNQPRIGSTFQTPRHPRTSYATAPTRKSSLLLTMFAYFQRADYVLTNLDGPLSTAVPVSTIRAATREVKAVLDYPARQRGRTLHWPSDANWVSVNPQKFSPQKLFSSNSRKFSPAIKTHYAVLAQTCLRAWLIGHT